MAKYKLLHLVGGETSVWLADQLASQYRLLPGDLFAQTVAVGEPLTARQIENRILEPVVRLHRRFQIELSAARNLRQLLKATDPDLVLCWDIQATEQLRLASLGSRRKMLVGALLFDPCLDRGLMFKLATNYRTLGLHLICGSDRMVQWTQQELAAQPRIHRVYPVVKDTGRAVHKSALREQMGLDPEAIPVFIPIEGRTEDIHQSIIGCGIVERVDHRLRIVMLGTDEEKISRYRQFIKDVIIPPVLHVINDWDPCMVIGACDFAIQPTNIYTETLALLQALGRSVAVIATDKAEPAELFVPGETYCKLEKTLSRSVASELYKLINHPEVRQTMLNAAQNLVGQNCSNLTYRASVVKLYQQMLTYENS